MNTFRTSIHVIILVDDFSGTLWIRATRENFFLLSVTVQLLSFPSWWVLVLLLVLFLVLCLIFLILWLLVILSAFLRDWVVSHIQDLKQKIYLFARGAVLLNNKRGGDGGRVDPQGKKGCSQPTSSVRPITPYCEHINLIVVLEVELS